MLDSVRVRLTLWYAAMMAVVLVALALITYFIFWQSTVQRTDADLAELSDGFLTTLKAEMGDVSGAESVKLAGLTAIAEHRFQDHVFAILDSNRNLVVSSPEAASAGPAQDSGIGTLLGSGSFEKFVEAADGQQRFFGRVRDGRAQYRGFARRFDLDRNRYELVILQSLHQQKEMLEGVTQTFAWLIPISLLLASASGYFLARKSLAPVVAMSSQAGRIGSENLHERLVVQNQRDELGRLALAFNDLLDRLGQSFERQKRFMADASHELRTPVAILRGESEVALSKESRSPEEYRESLETLHHESQRLTRIVEDLFTLTRADAGQYPLQPCDFYLDELVGECVHAARTLAQARQISLSCGPLSESPMEADESLLRRMILNLLDNAIKYTPEGGSVEVTCQRMGEEYFLTISDTGRGVPEELQPRIFERFVRVDRARSRSAEDGGGAGLGLSISRWIAEAHQGRLELTRSGPQGSAFTAVLPLRRAL